MKRIDQLKTQREELDKRIRELVSAEAKAQREDDKRRKIIIGGWVLKHRPELIKNIIANLEREQDKAAFEDFTIQATEQPKAAPAPTAQQGKPAEG
jgi:hypothetical protein